jgi:hypothetical protein
MSSLEIDPMTLSVENRRFLQELSGKAEAMPRD